MKGLRGIGYAKTSKRTKNTNEILRRLDAAHGVRLFPRGDAIHARSRDDTAERTRHAITLIIGHDQERTFGAALGGTTDGGRYGLESLASSLITPRNFGGSGESCLPSIVVVALGEPAPTGKRRTQQFPTGAAYCSPRFAMSFSAVTLGRKQ
jgi:hypothetical protein